MTTKEQLIKAIEQAPDAVIEEVFGFLLLTQAQYLQSQSKVKSASTPESTNAEVDELIVKLRSLRKQYPPYGSGRTWEEARAAIDRAQARYAGQTFSESADLIREDRDR